MYTLRKKSKRTKKKSLHPTILHFPFFSSITRISCFSVFFFLKKTQRNKATVFLVGVYITTCQNNIYKSYKKRYDKSWISSVTRFQSKRVTVHQLQELNTRAKRKINRVEWESSNSPACQFTESQPEAESHSTRCWLTEAGNPKMWVGLEPTSVPTLRGKLVLLDSVLVKPAQTLGEVPAQRDGEDVDEAEQSERVEQHHGVLQEG